MAAVNIVPILLSTAILTVSFQTSVCRPQHAVTILVDDLGYGDTGHRGAEYPTKHIDELALSGIRLNQSYVLQLCSPTRSSILASRYAYNMGMDGSVLVDGAARCINLTASTIGDQMHNNGVATAFIGKYDVGYSSWACTPNCRGFEYFLGYYGAAEDYYLHGSAKTLDFHENYNQAPQYRGQYSTSLFFSKASEWIRNTTSKNSTQQTYLHLATQAVHGPIEMPPGKYEDACKMENVRRKTYCYMMQALDAGVGQLVQTYKDLGIYNDTVFLFLADNGGTNQDGGFNVPLRGQKATVWEGGVRSQTFVSFAGFQDHLKGSMWKGLAHAVDWGVTLSSALGFQAKANPGEPPLDGLDLWPSISTGGSSPRTEMLLSMRDSAECGAGFDDCPFRGQLAYRKGNYKLIYGHTALRGSQGDGCEWDKNQNSLNCWNGYGVPFDVGRSRPPIHLNPRSGQPANSSIYSWGSIFLFDIENDPLEEHDLSQSHPAIVQDLIMALKKFNASQIDQSTQAGHKDGITEPCGDDLKCAKPWLPSVPDDKCKALPRPPSPAPAPTSALPSHITLPTNWKINDTHLALQGWICYPAESKKLPIVSLILDNKEPSTQPQIIETAAKEPKICGTGNSFGRFNHTFLGSGFLQGKHSVSGSVKQTDGTIHRIENSPECIQDGKPSAC